MSLSQLLVGAALLVLVLWEGVNVLRAVRAAHRDHQNPALFLRAVRGCAILTGGFFLELLLENRSRVFTASGSGFMAIICIVACLALTAIYFMVRHVEGTGDRPKNQ